jgi:hypothetical protein
MEHKFWLVRAPAHAEIRVIGYFSMNVISNMLRMGVPTAIVRIADGVIMATTGEDAYGLVTWIKDNGDLSKWVKNPIKKPMSKLPSQEKVSNFDPPVRTGDTLTKTRCPDISHFEDGRTLSPYGFVAKRNNLRQDGWKLNDHAGHGNNKCNTCNQQLMVDLYFVKGDLHDPAHEELCFELCLNCGYAVEQIAIYLELENV